MAREEDEGGLWPPTGAQSAWDAEAPAVPAGIEITEAKRLEKNGTDWLRLRLGMGTRIALISFPDIILLSKNFDVSS